jgi:hypothetical protein
MAFAVIEHDLEHPARPAEVMRCKMRRAKARLFGARGSSRRPGGMPRNSIAARCRIFPVYKKGDRSGKKAGSASKLASVIGPAASATVKSQASGASNFSRLSKRGSIGKKGGQRVEARERDRAGSKPYDSLGSRRAMVIEGQKGVL